MLERREDNKALYACTKFGDHYHKSFEAPRGDSGWNANVMTSAGTACNLNSWEHLNNQG